MFRNTEELNETFAILTNKYAKDRFVYSPFKIDNMTITFDGDSYYDPVLTIAILIKYGVLTGKFYEIGSEKDRVEITGANLEILRKLTECWPTWKNAKETLENQYHLKATIKREHITLKDGSQYFVITTKDWDKYFEIKGEKCNAWNIPTYKQFCQTLGMFAAGHAQGQEKQPESNQSVALK